VVDAAERAELDLAVLDVKVAGERIHPVAEALSLLLAPVA